MFEDLTLDDLAIRGSSHTSFFGVYLATHAVADAMCMCHASVGCKVKTQDQLGKHDGVQDAHNRRRYSQLIDEDLIQGTTAQLEDEIAAFCRRLQSQLAVISTSTPPTLQMQPLQAAVARSRERTGVDVLHVALRHERNDLWAGYAATAAALFRRQFERAETHGGTRSAPISDEVSLLGLPFDRYEGDCVGDVAELRRLLFALGLKAKAVFFAGEPYARLALAVNARAHLALPWLRPALADARAVADVTEVPLPMGFAGSRRFVEATAARLGLPASRAAAFCDAELAAAKPFAELARRRLAGTRYAAFAEAPRLAGLVALCSELDMVPAVLGVTHFSLGGVADVQRWLADDFGVAVPAATRWLADPAPLTLQGLAAEPPDGGTTFGDVDVVIASGLERGPLASYSGPWVEFGFPRENTHFLLPAPSLGFRGALRLAERLTQALDASPRTSQGGNR